MYEASRVIDLFCDLDSFLGVPHALTEVTDRGKALHKMATTDDRKNERGTKAFMSQRAVNAQHAALKNLDRLIVLARLVVSRAQVVPRHCAYPGVLTSASEAK